jgi:hypothetical protein
VQRSVERLGEACSDTPDCVHGEGGSGLVGGSHGHSHSHGPAAGKLARTAEVPPQTAAVAVELESLPAGRTAAHVAGPELAPVAGRSGLNMRGAFLHVLGDALGSIVVMISALINMYTDWAGAIYIDPALRWVRQRRLSGVPWVCALTAVPRGPRQLDHLGNPPLPFDPAGCVFVRPPMARHHHVC